MDKTIKTIEFDGKEYTKLALHGGGGSMLGHYVSFFEKLGILNDIKSFEIPVVTSSAGSLAVFFNVMKHFKKDACFGHIFDLLQEECANVLDNLDKKSVISCAFLESLITNDDNLSPMCDITFGDLKNINTYLEWTVCCSTFNNGRYSTHTFGTHTPDVLVWKAVLASASLPVIFEAVEINGSLYCDGDISDWVAHLNIQDAPEYLHITATPPDYNMLFDNYTEIPLVDEMLKFLYYSIVNNFRKTRATNVLIADVRGEISRNFLSKEYRNSGQKMAEKLVLK